MCAYLSMNAPSHMLFLEHEDQGYLDIGIENKNQTNMQIRHITSCFSNVMPSSSGLL